MDFLQALNDEQREAVLRIQGPLLILAGAGSGKTRVITSRIAYLVGDGHAQPDEVLAVTFTNKAAEEMRARVEALLGADCSRMWVSTFHSLCARLLRREAPAIGLTRDFVIYDSSDQLSVVKQALKSLHIDDSYVQPRAALSRISHLKNRMEGPEALEADAVWNRKNEQIAKVYSYYINALKESNALDFDDLLLKTVDLFEQSEQVRTKYSQRFRYVMVDEYQDTNRPQYLLIRRLAEVHRNLAVVGDPDQSIYKWRGADLRNILDFEHDFPEAAIVKLERNYRSTQIILDAASAVISQNRNRKDKRLWTDRTGGARIVYFRGADELEEADFIMRTARAALADDVEATVAVLYRTNAQSRTIEDALMREGLHYKIVGGVRFYERKEIKDALAYMRLVINPHDDVSLRRVINVPARGIGKGVMEADRRPRARVGVVRRPAAPQRRPSADVVRQLALGPHRPRSEGRSVYRPSRRVAGHLPRPSGVPHGHDAARVGVNRHRQDARPDRIPAGPARGTKRGSRRPRRKPGRAGVGRARVPKAATRSPRSAASWTACRSYPMSTRKRARATPASG